MHFVDSMWTLRGVESTDLRWSLHRPLGECKVLQSGCISLDNMTVQ